jgi:hypothetical protein
VVQFGGINCVGRASRFFRFDGHFLMAPTYPVGRASDFNHLAALAKPIFNECSISPVNLAPALALAGCASEAVTARYTAL